MRARRGRLPKDKDAVVLARLGSNRYPPRPRSGNRGENAPTDLDPWNAKEKLFSGDSEA